MWYDVIVVGGGPAGAMAAYELARAGLDVLLIERKLLPRFKACGGCLSPRVLNLLDFEVGEVIEGTVFSAIFTYRGRDPFSVSSEEPMGYMVERSRFDHLLCRKAVEAGARLLTGEEVKRVGLVEGGVEVATPAGRYRARLLIGADGARSLVRKCLFPDRRPIPLLALEGRITLPPKRYGTFQRLVLFDFGTVPRGYLWAFPKADHVNVGIMGPLSWAPRFKGLLFQFLNRSPFAGYRIELIRGAWIPAFGGKPQPVVSSRTLLIGDAAFLVDPLLGEGIYYGILSAQLAARSALLALHRGEELLEEYRIGLTEMYSEFRRALTFARLASRFPRLSYRLLKRRPGAVKAYANFLRGRETYRGLISRAGREVLAAFGFS